METRKYNGWTNYETWLCNLWYDDFWSDTAQGCYDDAKSDNTFTREENATIDLTDRIKSEIEEFSYEAVSSEASFWRDLVSAALSEINYYEIAEHYIAGVDKTEKEESEEDQTDDSESAV